MTTSFTHDSSHLAETYDRVSDTQFESGKRLAERLVEPGARVLDVGCGTGRLARWIAEQVGPKGSVVGIDPLAERIAIARRNAAPGISFEVGQAEDLSGFADASFDVVCMSAVFHWIENKPKALGEVRRVLRPGGLLGVTTLPRELMGSSSVATTLVPVLAQEPYIHKADLSALAIASRGHTLTEIVQMVLESGLQLVELHVMPRKRHHPTGADVVDFLESSSFGNFLRVVPEDLRPSLRADLASAFEAQHKGPDGIVMRDWGTVFVARRS
jgi:ubiquinone/menaquinone biosynthesis C-methylase UbiE